MDGDAEVTPEVMRAVLGTFCSGVVVVTSTATRSGRKLPSTDGDPLGFICQSFASLSLEPPLVTFSPARSSTTWPKIRELGRFCVNVLAHDQPDLSERFARRGIDRFAGVSWRHSPLGSPILARVSAWIDCTLFAEYDGGDHTIVLGTVHALAADPDRHPLIFYRGRYAPSEHWAAWPAILPS